MQWGCRAYQKAPSRRLATRRRAPNLSMVGARVPDATPSFSNRTRPNTMKRGRRVRQCSIRKLLACDALRSHVHGAPAPRVLSRGRTVRHVHTPRSSVAHLDRCAPFCSIASSQRAPSLGAKMSSSLRLRKIHLIGHDDYGEVTCEIGRAHV